MAQARQFVRIRRDRYVLQVRDHCVGFPRKIRQRRRRARGFPRRIPVVRIDEVLVVLSDLEDESNVAFGNLIHVETRARPSTGQSAKAKSEDGGPEGPDSHHGYYGEAYRDQFEVRSLKFEVRQTLDATIPPLLPLTVPIVSRRRAKVLLVQKLEHTIPSAVLLADGLRRFVAEPTPLSIGLAVAEVATSALVLRAFALAVRHAFTHQAVGHEHHGPDWLDIFLGVMVLTEVFVHYHETGHITRPKVLLAVTLVGLGVLHGKQESFVHRRRSLAIDDDGLECACG